MHHSSLKRQGIRAFKWDFFGKMATHGMSFIVSIFLARLLEPSDFGLIAMIMVIVGIAGVLTDVGLGAALIQRRKVRPIHYTSVFYFNIVIGLLLAVITYVSAQNISEFYENEQLLPLVQAMSLLFIINALSAVQSTKLRKELNYALLTQVSLVSSLLSGMIGISLALYDTSVWSLVAQSLSMGIVYNLLIWTRAQWTPTLAFSWKALTQLWGFGFRMFLSGMLDVIFTKIDFLIIGKLFPAATLGYFQRAKSLNSMVIQYSSGSLMAVLFPILSKVQNNLPRFQNIILKSLGIISFVTFLFLGALYLISEELILLLFSEKWLASVAIFKILVLSGFAYPISALLVNVLSGRGNSKAFLRLEIYKKLVASVNFIVLYIWGIDAFLYGLVVQGTIGVSLNIGFASKEIELPFLSFVQPIAIQMSIAVLSIFITQSILQTLVLADIIMLLVKGILFTMLYLFVNYVFKTSSWKSVEEQVVPLIKKKLN